MKNDMLLRLFLCKHHPSHSSQQTFLQFNTRKGDIYVVTYSQGMVGMSLVRVDAAESSCTPSARSNAKENASLMLLETPTFPKLSDWQTTPDTHT